MRDTNGFLSYLVVDMQHEDDIEQEQRLINEGRSTMQGREKTGGQQDEENLRRTKKETGNQDWADENELLTPDRVQDMEEE